jgi:hypothetical protein
MYADEGRPRTGDQSEISDWTLVRQFSDIEEIPPQHRAALESDGWTVGIE